MSDRTFQHNLEGLERIDARPYASDDNTTLRVDNLERDLAVRIAHELTKRLDSLGATGRSYNDTNYLLSSSLSTAHLNHAAKSQVVFESDPALGNYAVQVALPEKDELEKLGLDKGKFSIIATVAPYESIRGTKPPEELKAAMYMGYVSMLERHSFFPTEEQIDIEKTLLDLGVPITHDQRLKSEIEQNERDDTEAIEEMLINLGVKEISRDRILELEEIKKWDAISVTDLFLHVVSIKQTKSGSTFPKVFLKDLVQATDKVIAPKLREDQESQTIEIFKAIGFDEEDIKRRYEAYAGDENRRLALRFVAWLATQDFMEDFSKDVRKKHSAGETIHNIKLFKLASYHVYQQYRTHDKSKNEKFDLNVDWEKDEYNSGREFLRTTVLLCMSLLFDKDISKYRKPE